MGDMRDIGVCELRAPYAKANITAPLTYFASKANSSGQIATPGAARPGQQVITTEREGNSPQDRAERLPTPYPFSPQKATVKLAIDEFWANSQQAARPSW